MKRNKIFKIIYVAAFIVLMAVPGIWTIFQKKTAIGNEEKQDMAGATYLNFSDKFDSYFSTSFGFRSQLVGLNNSLLDSVFNESGEDSVIIGRDGWLFYESALHDYIGQDVMTDAQIAKVVKILELSEEYIESRGSKLIFAVAPNKMEIYGNEMPYYYIEDTDAGNYEKLMLALKTSNVSYVDLKSVLKEKAESTDINIYHKLDSHWNNLGAATAYETIMDAAGMEHTTYADMPYTVRENFKGDLYAMLYPDGRIKDEQMTYQNMKEYEYTSVFRGEDDMLIDAQSQTSDYRLMMFRDSFGNALHSFFAADFGQSEFSRNLPYTLEDTEGTDLTVFEIVERNIANLLLYPPVAQAMSTDISAQERSEVQAAVNIENKGEYKLITINCQDIPADCVNVYMRVGDKTYAAYPSALDGDACLYIKTTENITLSECSVLYEKNNTVYETIELR